MKEFTAIIGVLLTWVCLLPEHLPAQGPNVEGDEESRPESDAPIIARAGDQVPAKAKPSVELQRLQGTWEGFQVGDQAKVRITITGQSLHFHRDKNFWFETTITLPADKSPKQLHSTIKDCPPSQANSIGEVVRAFFKVEDGTLTLATLGDDAEETPQAFEAAGTRYELLKVQPQEKDGLPPKADGNGAEPGRARQPATVTNAQSESREDPRPESEERDQ